MKEVIVRLTSDHIKVKGGEYIRDYEPKRGKWKRRIVDGGWNANLVCSECGYTLMIEDGYNFCPNCGADMRGESE